MSRKNVHRPLFELVIRLTLFVTCSTLTIIKKLKCVNIIAFKHVYGIAQI